VNELPSVQFGGENLYITPFSYRYEKGDGVCYYHSREFLPMGGYDFERLSEFGFFEGLWYKFIGGAKRLFGVRIYKHWWVVKYCWHYTIPFRASEIYDGYLIGLPFTLVIGTEKDSPVEFQYLCPSDSYIAKRLEDSNPFGDVFEFNPNGPLMYVDDRPEFHDENVKYQQRRFADWRRYKAWEYTQKMLGRQISYIVELDT